MNRTVTPHPIYVASLLYPYLTLLIIPVLRGLYGYFRDGERRLSGFLLAEILMLMLAVFFSVFSFKRTKIIFSENIHVSKGLFCRVSYTIPKRAGTVLVTESNPLLRPFGIYRLKIYTEAGNSHKPDENIPVRKRDILKIPGCEDFAGRRIKSGAAAQVLTAAALSSSSAGLLISAPLVRAAAGLLDRSVASLLPEIADAARLPEQIPDVGKYISLALLAGYMVSFIVILLRGAGFASLSSETRLRLDSGLFPRRSVFIKKPDVTAVKTVTAPLMWPAARRVIQFSSCGYGLAGGELDVLAPCVRPIEAARLTRILLPQFEGISRYETRPKASCIGRCFSIPVFLSAAIAFFGRLLSFLFPHFGAFIWFLAAVLLGFDGLFLAIRLYILFCGRISVGEGIVAVKYKRRFSGVEMKCGAKYIECIQIKQTPFDRLYGVCSVTLRLCNKNRDKASLQNIGYKNAVRFFENIAAQNRKNSDA